MSPSRREDYDLAKDIWRARDQYRVENFLLGCGTMLLLCVIGFVLFGIVMLSGCTDVVQKVATTMGCPGYYSLDHNCQSPERKP